jgi:hypothetical protein
LNKFHPAVVYAALVLMTLALYAPVDVWLSRACGLRPICRQAVRKPLSFGDVHVCAWADVKADACHMAVSAPASGLVAAEPVPEAKMSLIAMRRLF